MEKSLRARLRAIKLLVFDFDGVFTDNTVYVDEDGRESVRCWRGDGPGLRALPSRIERTFVLTSEVTPAIKSRCRKMNIAYYGAERKWSYLDGHPYFTWNETAFVGNDVNDLECLRAVAVPILVANTTHIDVRCALDDKFHLTTMAFGGRGAVREVCEWFVEAWKEEQDGT